MMDTTITILGIANLVLGSLCLGMFIWLRRPISLITGLVSVSVGWLILSGSLG